MLKHLKIAVKMALATLLLTGVLYPLALTLAAQAAFPHKANGSLVYDHTGKLRGSERIAQSFRQPEYFHPRPSAVGYDASGGGASNLGPTSRALAERVASEVKAYRRDNDIWIVENIPVDAVTASASGLDPDITLENAHCQLKRVARARSLSTKTVWGLILENATKPLLGVLGERRVNVLKLNLALDRLGDS